MREFTIRQDGQHVLLLVDGRLVGAPLPWDAALEIGRAIIEKARAAEEIAKVSGVISDQALLLRSGAPFGFTSHPAIQAEAAKEAQSNPKLRRALPGGIKSQEQLGKPTVIRHPPPRRSNNGQGLQ